jgi:hypothetical protein
MSRGAPIGPGNAYYDLLGSYWKNDPARIADLGDETTLVALIRRRFEDFYLFRTHPGAATEIEPLCLVAADGPPTPSLTRDVKLVYEPGSEVPVETTTMDGYHRLFLARLFGLNRIPCDFVAQRDALPDLEP